MELCRACLLSDIEMVAFDEYSIMNYNTLTNLDVNLLDGLPQCLCKKCTEALKFFINFRSKAISSESSLKGALKNIKSDCEDQNEISIEIEQAIEKGDENIQQWELKMEGQSDSWETDTKIKKEKCHGLDVKQENDLDEDNEDNFNYEFLYDNIDNHCSDQFYSWDNVKELNKTKRVLRSSKKRTLKAIDDVVPVKSELKTKKRNKKKVKKKAGLITDIYLCGLCKKKFNLCDDMKSHLEIHKKSLYCEICQEKFNSWQQLFGHRLQHLSQKESRCHICNKRYWKTFALEYHYFKEHSGHEVQEIWLKCNICAKSYDKPSKLRKHINSIHQKKSTIYICDYCSKRCHNKQVLRCHIASHVNAKTYTCKLCTFACNHGSNLTEHIIRKHTPEKFTCIRCLRLFKTRDDHDRHRTKCTTDNFVCSVCGKKKETTTALRRHMLTHDPGSTFKCDRCPKSFRTKYGLKSHQDRHDGTPSHKCNFCPRKFYTGSSRIKHHRTHTGEKPYVCNICARGFGTNSNLKMHMKVHGLFLIKHKNTESEPKTE